MKKENFKYLYSFKYKNKNYAYFFNKNYPFYVLEIDIKTKKLSYPEYNDFIELFNLYNKNTLLYINKQSLEVTNKNLLNQTFSFIPKVKYMGATILLSVALSLTGCTVTPPQNEEVAINIDENKEIDTDIEILKSSGYNAIRKYYADDNNYIFLKNYYSKEKQKETIYCENIEQFKEFTKLDITPTFDDIINAIKENKNIKQKYSDYLLKYVNEMKNDPELNTMDLSTLYLNLKKMKIIEISSEEICNRTENQTAAAFFDSVTGYVYIPNDQELDEFIFCHEAIGHGSTVYREETDNCYFTYDFINQLMLPTEDNSYYGCSIGTVLTEGSANIIATRLTKKELNTFYRFYEEELRVIKEVCNLTYGELFNEKGINFYDTMYKKGKINKPVDYIRLTDALFKGQENIPFSYLMETLVLDGTVEDLLNCPKDEEQKIIENALNIIKESNFKDGLSESKLSISYNPKESVDSLEINLKEVIKSK